MESLSAKTLARTQFAFTVSFHILVVFRVVFRRYWYQFLPLPGAAFFNPMGRCSTG